MEDDYRDTDDRPRSYTWLKATGALAAVAALFAAIWMLSEMPKERNLAVYPNVQERADQGDLSVRATAPGEEAVDTSDAIGTSGAVSAADAGGFEATAPSIIQDLATITGDLDGTGLIGRRVDLHVPVLQEHNALTFWVGSADNRLLVVLERDVRDSAEHQSGRGPAHGILPVQRGQQATISGTIQAVPPREERASWGLTNAQQKELESRRIYLRADTVRSAGHGE